MEKKRKMPTAQRATIVLTAIAVGLLVGGFFCPPMGKIDGSVLQGAGILLGFAALWVCAEAFLERGADAKMSVHAGAVSGSIEVDVDKEKQHG